MDSAAIKVFFESMVFSATLVIGFGPSNIFIIRQGLRKNHVGLSALGCILIDVVMILVSLCVLGELLEYAPRLRLILLVMSSIFILTYMYKLLRSSTIDVEISESGGSDFLSATDAFAVSVGLSLLNPNVWMDMLLIVGGYLQNIDAQFRWWAASGACLTSIAWFPLLGFSAAGLQRFAVSGRAIRIIELGSVGVLAVILVCMWVSTPNFATGRSIW